MTHIDAWSSEIQHRIKTILAAIEGSKDWGRMMGLSEAQLSSFTAEYDQMLEELYTDDLQLAHLLDEADLVIGAKGPSADMKGAPLSLVASLIDMTRREVNGVVRAISSARGKRMPKAYEPAFVGLARGSIYIGVNAPEGGEGIFPDDPMLKAVKTAMQSIKVVSKLVAEESDIDTIAAIVPDPAVRDAALKAVQNLSPNGRSGVDQVIIGGSATEIGGTISDGTAVLTKNSRTSARDMSKKPRKESETGEFKGEVREIDLDSRRFELRRISGLDESISIRCVYPDKFVKTAHKWLDQFITVSGIYERDSEGFPRLMHVETVRVEKPTHKQPKLLN